MRRIHLILLFTLYLAAVSAPAAAEADLRFQNSSFPIRQELAPSGQTGLPVFQTGLSEQPGEKYDSLLLQGELPDPNLTVEVWLKPRALPFEYAKFRPAEGKVYPDGRFWAKYSFDKIYTEPVMIVVVDDGFKKAGTFVLYGAETFKEAAMKESRPEPWNWNQPYNPDPSFFLSTGAPFAVVRRDEWKAKAPKDVYTPHIPTRLTLHHTQGRYPQTYEEALREVSFIQDFHQNGRKWIDIGYQFLVSPDGRIFEGRPMYTLGAHVKNQNTGNIGISLMGNYHEPANQQPTAPALAAFTQVARFTAANYSIISSSFYAHRDLQNTDCPGDILYAKMPEIRDMVFTNLPPPAFPVHVPVVLSSGTAVGAEMPDVPVTPAQAAALRRLLEPFR